MNLPDAIINRVYLTKNGETVISFKVKPEDLPPEQRETLLEYWRDGTLLQFAVERFQDENQQEGQEEVKPREKTVYERLRWEVVKDMRDEDREAGWTNFKLETAISLGKAEKGCKYITSPEIWTPEEAEKLIAEFQGIPALEQTKNL